ncbi:uncharacterized protein BO95DRAFT_489991 [Aspergillus brunneoviolaceus CBS 621.78]|uniref:Uncharacterized protein n=1 Tax=Aspergillus brunneoviolaceus CBS 621.78 TaxID=1450534 RepID=A0ACD1GHD3_9EURO|nr:hypothetical protein BO95DRAFT_489991 [Aspergillus brunneoviolaceus CBS 621.78]RAH48671.1 hypothetical protein BO95DRAFT_489991 [Aspergillus brunneoviolaceus CBS 621.78]
MATPAVLRQCFLGLVALVCLFLVHQSFQVAGSSRLSLQSRNAESVTSSLGWAEASNVSIAERYYQVQSRDEDKKDPLTLEGAIVKGRGLYCRSAGVWTLSDEPNPSFTYADLEEYYSEQYYDTFTSEESIGPALQALGLPSTVSTNGGADGNLVGKLFHQNEGPIQTNMEFGNPMSVRRGVIVAETNWGPASQKKTKVFPPLKRWSDIVFLAYQKLAEEGGAINGLQYVVRTHVLNDDTRAIIHEVCGGPPPVWPGTTFKISNKQSKSGEYINREGLALLGTPNGGGIG